MAKALVVFYSRKGENHMPGGIQVLEKGNTAYAAEYVAKAVNADLFEIDTVVPYAENYRQCCGQAVAENKAKARPEIKGYVEDISGYDTIFVCYPNWCGTAPMCVFTFLEHYDFTGKKIMPLCTNEGSGMGYSETSLKESCKGAKVEAGLSVRGHLVQELEADIRSWALANK
jgi:flavodoxin